MKKKFILNYILLLPLSFLIFAAFWNPAAEKLFYCSDSFPLLNFIPPFVHGRTQTDFYKSRNYGDYYIASPTATYVVWCIFVISALITPALVLYIISNFQQQRIKAKLKRGHTPRKV